MSFGRIGSLGAGFGSLGSGRRGGLPNLFNFNRSQFDRFRAALTNTAGGASNTIIACVGDSKTRGSFSASGAAEFLNGYPPQLAQILQSRLGLPSNGLGNLWGNGTTSTVLPDRDSRVTISSNWAASSVLLSFGGNIIRANAAGTFTFTPPSSPTWDTCDFYYTRSAGAGTENFNITGQSATLINCNGTTGLLKATQTTTLGANAAVVDRVTGTTYIVGFDTYNSAIKQISVWNWGAIGSTAAFWSNTTDGVRPINAVATAAPHLIIDATATNDWNAATDVATYKTRKQEWLTAALAATDVLLIAPGPTQNSTTALSTQAQYVAALYELAAENNIALLDIFGRFQSWERMNAMGKEGDPNHENQLGYADIAAAVGDVLALAA